MTVSDLYEAKSEFLHSNPQLDPSVLVAIEIFTDYLANQIYLKEN